MLYNIALKCTSGPILITRCYLGVIEGILPGGANGVSVKGIFLEQADWGVLSVPPRVLAALRKT